MRYASSVAFRTALEQRINAHAGARGLDPARLRKRVVFERVVARLVAKDPEAWVVKGGIALEARLPDKARATRDLDLALRGTFPGEELREWVGAALLLDPYGDGFEFEITGIEALTADDAGRPGYRLPLTARLGGRVFDSSRLEIVSRDDELVGVERVELPNSLAFADLPVVVAPLVDERQHFAEKLHAFTRSYGDRENSRVKDLVDLVLLIENGLEETLELRTVVYHVFAVRATHPVPDPLPDPPVLWRDRYAAIVAELGVGARTIDDAMALLRTFWAEVPA